MGHSLCWEVTGGSASHKFPPPPHGIWNVNIVFTRALTDPYPELDKSSSQPSIFCNKFLI
jgi:hypothetical protein